MKRRSHPTRAALVAFVLALLLALTTRSAHADGGAEALFNDAVKALNEGATDDAIDRFELLADRGVAHPDASFDRGMAYVRRAESHGARPGDWGRAAAALNEVLLFRPDDADARVALERIRQEVVRRRARARASDVELKPSLGWAVVELLEEDTWAIIAAVGSLVSCLGLGLRFWSRASAVRLAGVVASSLGVLTLVLAGVLAGFARQGRLHARPAVVIVEEARLLDEAGVAISGVGARIPEGALVNVQEQQPTEAREARQSGALGGGGGAGQMQTKQGSLVHVEWGTLDGWLSLGQLRLLSHP